MSESLKGCPLCGGNSTAQISAPGVRHPEKQMWVVCQRCGCSSGVFYGDAHAELLSAWNRRALTGTQPAPAAPELNTRQEIHDHIESLAGPYYSPPLDGEPSAAPAVPSGYLHEVDETAHGRGCLRMYSSTAESPWAHWQDAYKAKCVLKTTPLFAAPAAQPADSAMEVLRELVDAHDAFHAWMQAPTITPGEEWDHTARMNTAWTRARALVAKETPHG